MYVYYGSARDALALMENLEHVRRPAMNRRVSCQRFFPPYGRQSQGLKTYSQGPLMTYAPY